MPMESVYPRLEPLLPRVPKPIADGGGAGEPGVKDWDATNVRWALLYPDAYEVGLPNQGVQILYEILNERDGVLAERTYSVWPDLEGLMREHGVPQFTVDGHRPVGAFDLLGVSFSTELGYTNLLTALDLAGIPLHSEDRNPEERDPVDRTWYPLVIAGAPAAFTPSRSPTSWTAWCWPTANRPSSTSPTTSGPGSRTAAPVAATACSARWPMSAACTSRASTT